MTHEQWIALTPEAQRIRVAELHDTIKPLMHDGYARGYRDRQGRTHFWCDNGCLIPNYPNCLNAMHEAVEAECAKNPYFRLEFAEALMEVVTGLSYNRDDCVENFEDIVTATAEQRAEAFVIVMTKSPTPWPGCRYLGADTWTTVKQKEVL